MFKKILSCFTLPLLLLLSNSSGNSAPRAAAESAPEGFVPGPDVIAGNMADLYQDGAIWDPTRPGDGNNHVQRRKRASGFFRDTGDKSPGRCPESLSNERWIGQRRSLRANWPGVGETYVRGRTSQCLL